MPDAPADGLLAGLDYPMFVVTAGDDEPAGCLVGFATQCSIGPARFLVCLSVKNHTYPVALRAGHLGVHLLESTQRHLAELFGSRTGDDTDKFADVRWRRGPHGVPLLDDCPHWIAGEVLSQHPLGDHVGFLLQPVAGSTDAAPFEPLMFSDVRDLDAGHGA